MAKPTQAERTELWKLVQARSAFYYVREFCRLWPGWEGKTAAVAGSRAANILKHSLTISIVGLYGRPFKERAATRLSSDLIPRQSKALHERLIIVRDKLIIHRDVSAHIEQLGQALPVVGIARRGNNTELKPVQIILEMTEIRRIHALAGFLIRQLDFKTVALIESFKPLPVLSEGMYVLSLEENPPEWLFRKDISHL